MSYLFDRFFSNKQGIVNVRMVITEEKILSNIEKVQKMINPNSKKQIVQLEEDSYFKDLVESIKTYLEEYPKKKNFPSSVYKASYDLVEFATNQFEENTRKIEELIIQREKNIGLAYELKSALAKVLKKEEGYQNIIDNASVKFSEDIGEALTILASDKSNDEKSAARKLIDARINNLESNFHIEIDMERIEDRSKALSYIGIEIAEVLKYIPTPVEGVNTVSNVSVEQPATPKAVQNVVSTPQKAPVGKTNIAAATVSAPQVKNETKVNPILATENNNDEMTDAYMQETRFDVKPSLWQRVKNSKLIRTIRYIMKIRVVLEFPALPEGRGDNN